MDTSGTAGILNEMFLDKLGTDPKKVSALALEYLKTRLEALDGRPSVSIEDVVVSRHEDVVKLGFVLMYRQKGLVCTESWTEKEVLALDKPITAMMEKVLYTALKTLPIKDPPPPVDKTAIKTLHGTPVEELRETHANEPVGMHKDYIVLSDEERSRGFVRRVRRSYTHVGIPGPQYSLRDLTKEEHERYYDKYSYVKFEEYPEGHAMSGRYWTQAQLDSIGKGCGESTSMGIQIAETYARDPRFYGATFCVGCNKHLPVGEGGEFVWEGTNERVGT